MNRLTLRVGLLFCAMIPVASIQTGCVAVVAGAAGAGAVAYVRGELRSNISASLDSAQRATNGALSQLQLIKINEKRDAFLSIITARTADDKKIEITLTKIGDQTTKVQIRVGMFGDEAKSLAILDKIRSNL